MLKLLIILIEHQVVCSKQHSQIIKIHEQHVSNCKSQMKLDIIFLRQLPTQDFPRNILKSTSLKFEKRQLLKQGQC